MAQCNWKERGVIVGITRTPTALSRWSLSYSLRSHISYLTKSMFHVNPEDLMNHKEATKSRQKLDSKSEDSLFRVLTNFGMFNFTNESDHLLSIATKDKATDVIKNSLLNARKIGQKQLEDFVKDRLVLKDEELSPKIPLLTSQQKQSTNNGILV